MVEVTGAYLYPRRQPAAITAGSDQGHHIPPRQPRRHRAAQEARRANQQNAPAHAGRERRVRRWPASLGQPSVERRVRCGGQTPTPLDKTPPPIFGGGGVNFHPPAPCLRERGGQGGCGSIERSGRGKKGGPPS